MGDFHEGMANRADQYESHDNIDASLRFSVPDWRFSGQHGLDDRQGLRHCRLNGRQWDPFHARLISTSEGDPPLLLGTGWIRSRTLDDAHARRAGPKLLCRAAPEQDDQWRFHGFCHVHDATVVANEEPGLPEDCR